MEAFPEEFHRDVVKVAWDSKEPWIKVAVDLGISPATLCNRWRQVNIETRPQNTL
jgi:transposase-like protein